MGVKKTLNYVFVGIWMGVIFYMSSLRFAPSSQISVLDFIFKKTAHIIEYAILSILIYRTHDPKNKHKLLNSLSIALFYAFTDEAHQLFTPGRGGKIRDVGFDLTGIIIGLYLIGQKRITILRKNMA